MNRQSFLEKHLTSDVSDMLEHIYEPTVVATPLSDAGRSLTLLPSGEIREYGTLYKAYWHDPNGQRAYIASHDCGVSWTLHYDHGALGACLYLPDLGIYLKSTSDESGTYILRSAIGPDDPAPERIKISDLHYFCQLLPQQCKDSGRIFFTAQRKREDGINLPAFLYSDDGGKSFRITELPPPPRHEVAFPHKGIRWSICNGSEPCAVDLGGGKIMMLIRTSTDFFYQAFSEDGGEHFGEMMPAPFHGTNTTAFLLKLSDGRILALWNNTQPLPEEDHEAQKPPLPQSIKIGYWEDVFTNRDAAHAAISEDGGKSWIGYREILLNPIRNAEDFRYAGSRASNDKSVHQFEAMELPMGKVLVSAGQNAASRRLLIFDLRWLYEAERKEDFIEGLKNVSTQTYLKSIAGSTMEDVGNGHCSYNRISSAVMLPDPEGGYRDYPFIGGKTDERLMHQTRGLVWNFPAARAGEVSIALRLDCASMHLTLSDRWFNPADEYAPMLSPLSFEIKKEEVKDGFFTLSVHFDTQSGWALLLLDGQQIKKEKMKDCLKAGLSYLILQCEPSEATSGIYLKELMKKQGTVME